MLSYLFLNLDKIFIFYEVRDFLDWWEWQRKVFLIRLLLHFHQDFRIILICMSHLKLWLFPVGKRVELAKI